MSEACVADEILSGNGEEYYETQLETCSILRSWIPGLDAVLQGGSRMGAVLEICGVSGSGKTQLCLNIAINWAAKYKVDVFYVDTKDEILGSRLLSLVEEHRLPESTKNLSERIQVAKAKDMFELIATLHNLQQTMRARRNLKAIIIDSLAALYIPFIGLASGDNHEGINLLSHVAALLGHLTIRHNLAIVMTNLVLQWRHDEGFDDDPSEADNSEPEQVKSLKSAMGKFWAHVPNTRLLLSKDTTNCCTVSVLKSDYLPRRNGCKILMNSNGTIT